MISGGHELMQGVQISYRTTSLLVDSVVRAGDSTSMALIAFSFSTFS
jgi:hypothetical protein